MKNILLIGGNGYIGFNLIKSFLNRKEYNINLLTSRTIKSHFSENLQIINGQISDYDKINSIIDNKKIDTIIHLACSILPNSSFEDFLKEQKNIIIPTYKLIKLCSKRKIMFVFFSSGGAVYGNSRKIIEESSILRPISYYGHAKKMIEDFIRLQSHLNDLKFLILRPSNPYGGYNNYKKKHGLILAIINSIISQQPLNIFVKKIQ
jgi:UDP-glucose 4-epimerase